MTLEEFRIKVRDYLEKSQALDAIDFIKDYLQPNSSLVKELTLMKNFASRINYDKTFGLQDQNDLRIEENKLVKLVISFLDNVRTTDLRLETLSDLRLFKAVGSFKEMRITELGEDFKSKHLIENFDYSKIGSFEVEYFKLIIEIDIDKITITGEQNIKFRKNKITGEEKVLHNYFNAEGLILGEYAYLGFYNTQIEGIAIHRGTMVLNISDMKGIYGYLMTPDIELPGIIALGRVEMTVID